MINLNFINRKPKLSPTGILAALCSAFLFGIGMPLCKLLLNEVNPWMLAGLLYLGSGVGLSVYRLLSHAPKVKMPRHDLIWFLSAILSGGIIAPVLLMLGLLATSASGASLLLNSESVFTTLVAWFVFKENFDRRIALGIIFIIAGATLLSWPNEVHFSELWPALAIIWACFMWAIDNNLTRKVSLYDATWIAAVKGLISGVVNITIAIILGAKLPPLLNLSGALVLGFVAYGVSLMLFVIGLRHLGAARTGAYFSIAPFIGALLALIMGEPLTLTLFISGALMAVGIWLHITEYHAHFHVHEAIEHSHEHRHDEHHLHDHDIAIKPGIKHRHLHKHAQISHTHAHFPDAHHLHKHN